MSTDVHLREPALSKIVDIAHRIDARDPQRAELVRAIMFAVAEARLGERPRPIETAPHVPTRIFLLYCPKQGGWQTGEWYPQKDRWVSNMNMETLHPTHWTGVPREPQQD